MRHSFALLAVLAICACGGPAFQSGDGDAGADAPLGVRGDAGSLDATDAPAGDAGSSEGGLDAVAFDGPIDGPGDQGQGEAPAGPPLCQGVPSSEIAAAMSCAEQYCSTKAPGDGSGMLIGAGGDATLDCLVSNCAGQFLAVQNSTQGDGPKCYDCLVNGLEEDVSFADTRTQCTGGA